MTGDDKLPGEKRSYGPPEIMRLGDAVELTAGGPKGPISDGAMKPNGYKDVEWEGSAQPQADFAQE